MQLEKATELLLPADTDQRYLLPLNGNSVRGSIAVDFADQSAVQQSNPLHNEPVALVPQKDFAPS